MSTESPTPAKRKGPKPREFTETERSVVKRMVLAGIPHDLIAQVLSTTKETLYNRFRDEIDFEKAKVSSAIVGRLVQKALDGNLTAIIFYLKTQCGWRETQHLEHTGQIVVNVNRKPSDEPGN